MHTPLYDSHRFREDSSNSLFHSHILITYELLEYSSGMKETGNLAQGYIPLFLMEDKVNIPSVQQYQQTNCLKL